MARGTNNKEITKVLCNSGSQPASQLDRQIDVAIAVKSGQPLAHLSHQPKAHIAIEAIQLTDIRSTETFHCLHANTTI